MKKTVTINISGVIFHIDEDAYHALSQYLDLLKHHFSQHEGSREILDDIENRIAEILQGKILESRQVITIEDVSEIKQIMGEPEEISGGEPTGDAVHERVEKGPKRFFRNPDEKVVAGVCSGIAAYFHFDPVWVRLAFILAVVFFGSGILLYIILWIVMPEAVTTTDRLEMRGEKVTVSNIERSLREEFRSISQRFGARGSSSPEAREATSGPTWAEILFRGIGEVVQFAFRILVIILGGTLMLLGVLLTISLLILVFGWGGAMGEVNGELLMSFPDMARMLLGCSVPVVYLQITLLLLVGIPVIALIYSGIRMVFRMAPVRHLGLTLFNIWIIGLILTAYFAVKFGKQFRTEERVKTEFRMAPATGDTLVVAFPAGDPTVELLDQEVYNLFDEFRIIPDGDSHLNFLPQIYCIPSDDTLFRAEVTCLSRGRSRQEARGRVEQIHYPVVVSGDTLFLPPVYRIPVSECWKGEQVILRFEVPEGKVIRPVGRARELFPRWGCGMDE